MIKGFCKEYYIRTTKGDFVLIDRKPFFKKREILLFKTLGKDHIQETNEDVLKNTDTIIGVSRVTGLISKKKGRNKYIDIKTVRENKINFTEFS